ncbi:maleylpyruvate isomerase family mycothiol-dependent enzyme [Streptomyces sp. NPDC000851]
MTTDHDAVRELLAAWAFGALEPADEKTIPPHLATCETCAREAERLRAVVRMLEGPAPAASASDGSPSEARPPASAPLEGPSSTVLARALRHRAAAPAAAPHAAPYAAAVSGLKALLSEADGRWGTPVVHDWDVHATVAHLLAADEPLATELGAGTGRPPSGIEEGTPWDAAWNRRTAEVIAHERGRSPGETVAAWSAQAAALLSAPEARDAQSAARAVTLMGLRLPVADHFLVRAFETWIHADDIGRALGLAVPPPPEEHLRHLIRLAVRILGAALGPTAPPVLFSVTGGPEWVLGSDAEPVRAELALDPVDFCLLVGGRYPPQEVPRGAAGDESAVRNVLERAASLAWL